MPFIEAVDLRKTYHVGKVEVPALRGVTFTVERGKFVSVVAPRVAASRLSFIYWEVSPGPTPGRVVIDGDDFSQLSDADRTRMRKRKRIRFPEIQPFTHSRRAVQHRNRPRHCWTTRN